MKQRTVLTLIFTLCFLLLNGPQLQAAVLIVAPHPDDDLIYSAGVIYRAVQRKEPVRVVFMTNGDFGGMATGYLRQGEAVAGEACLGVPEDSLLFLGYPDGYLSNINLSCPAAEDTCTSGNGISATYGNRGLGRASYHAYRFGAPAAYNRENILIDLQDIIASLLPSQIFVTAQFDTHADHSTTYHLVTAAVAAVNTGNPSYRPVINKTIVHWSSDFTGAVIDPTTFFDEVPDLADTTDLTWSDRESLDVPPAMQSDNYASNPKYQAIAKYVSQGGATGFLGHFLHKDEFFWAESVLPGNAPPIVNAGWDQLVLQGSEVRLDGSLSSDPDGDQLTYQWVQRAGTPVQLSNAAAATPSFTAPTGLTRDEILTFELAVSDGAFTSTQDSVAVTVLAEPAGSSNIAPLAKVTASSAEDSLGQGAVKAVDGVVNGYPHDATREWATRGELNGAWLKLSWPTAYNVSRVVLYDRPNFNDNIVAATLAFSDGTSVRVGPLYNNATPTIVTFPVKAVSEITMNVTAVSAVTQNTGLAEIQVFGSRSQNQYKLTVGVTPSGTGSVTLSPDKASYYQGEQVTLTAVPAVGYSFSGWRGDAGGTTTPLVVTVNGNLAISGVFVPVPGTLSVTPVDGIDAAGAPGGPITPSVTVYTVRNVGSSPLTWSAAASEAWSSLSSKGGSLKPGASATLTVSLNRTATTLPPGFYSGTVTFTNQTNGNGSTSRSLQLAIGKEINLAPLASATASSESTQSGQTAVKAVDGVIDGYPGDYTREWASAGEHVGAWLKLTWATPHLVNRIVLYDRPNSNDNITEATLTFSDGSTVPVGLLFNDGSATEISFPARTVTAVTLKVTGVSSSTQNSGLSEIQVFGY